MRRSGPALAALAVGAALAGASPAVRGGFSAEQAREGADVYAAHCAMCHGQRLEGTVEIPALTGRFVGNWAGRPGADLLRYVETAMPQHAPGALDRADARRVVAFILDRNGYVSGGAATGDGALGRTLPPPGPARN